MSIENKFITIKEVAKILQLSISTIYKMVQEKKIPCYKPNGKMLYFKKEEVEQWVEQSKVSINHED